jgi:hypothetical protein
VVFLLALVHLFIYTKNIGLHYETKQNKIKLRELHDQTRGLQGIIARKRSLYRIESVAKEKLNMEWPAEVTYVYPSPEVK